MSNKHTEDLLKKRKTSLDIVAQALKLSAHALEHDSNQLAGQLVGRLMTEEAPAIQGLVKQAKGWKGAPWLCPLRPTLTAPGRPLLRTLEIESAVNAVAVTPDGSLGVSGSRDHIVRVWDLERGVCIHTLTGHRASVHALALTSDGRYAISGSLDRTMRIWDLKTGDCVKVLPVIDRVRALALSSDDRLVITSGADHEKLTPSEIRKLQSGGQVTVTRPKADDTIRVWDLVSGALLRSIKADSTQGPAHKTAQGIESRIITRYSSPEPIGEIRGLTITPDDQFVVAGSSRYNKHRVRIWRLEDGKRIHALKGHTGEVWSVVVTPDGHHIISGSEDGTIRVWHLQTGRCVKVLAGHRGGVRSLAMMHNGSQLISGGSDKTVKIWNLASGKCIYTLPAHSYWVLSVAVTWDGHLALSGSEDRTVRVWDLDRARETKARKVDRHHGEVWDVTLTTDGRFALSGAEDATLRVWDVQSGEAVGALHGHNGAIYAVAPVPDSDVVVSASQDGTIRVWDLEEQREVHVLEVRGTSIGQIAITPDGRYVVSGEMIPVSSSGQPTIGTAKSYNLRVWDLQNGDCVHLLKGHQGPINALVLTPNGQEVLSASSDRTMRLWSLQTGTCLRTLKGHTGSVRRVVISPDGRLALSASADSTLRLWELKGATCRKVFDAHTDQVLCVRMTPNGRLALSGGRDRTLRLWDLQKGTLLRTFCGHRGMVGAVAITPDGRYGLSGSEDQTIRVWDLARGDQVAAFYADRVVNSLAYRGDAIVFGDDQGHIHLLRMHGFHAELPFVTARSPQTQHISLVGSRRMVARCPLCGDSFRVSRKHTTFISDQLQSAGLRQAQSRCLHLPPEAWDKPELHSKCPGCDQPLRFNPFIADSHTWLSEPGQLQRRDSTTAPQPSTQAGSAGVGRPSSRTVQRKPPTAGTPSDWSKFVTFRVADNPSRVTAIAVGSKGQWCVSGLASGDVYMTNLFSREVVHTLAGHRGPVEAIAYVDDTKIVTASQDGSILTWDPKTGDRLCRSEIARPPAKVALTPGGNRAVSVSADGMLRVWDVDNDEQIREFSLVAKSILQVAVSADATQAVLATEERLLLIIDLTTGATVNRVSFWEPATSIVVAKGNGGFCFSLTDGSVLGWRANTKTSPRMLYKEETTVTDLALTHDDRWLISVSEGGILRAWDWLGDKLIASIDADSGLTACAAIPSGSRAVAGDKSRGVRVLIIIP